MSLTAWKDMSWCYQWNNTGFALVSKNRANLCHDASTVMFACACYFTKFITNLWQAAMKCIRNSNDTCLCIAGQCIVKMLRRVGSSFLVLCSCLRYLLSQVIITTLSLKSPTNCTFLSFCHLFCLGRTSWDWIYGYELFLPSSLQTCRTLVAWAFFPSTLASFLLLLKGSYSHNRCDFAPHCIVVLILCTTVQLLKEWGLLNLNLFEQSTFKA